MNKLSVYLLAIIFFVALGLRIYNLNDFPVGFHADEVKVGWNAYSILKTGQDDRGNKLAFYYNTFGDYRPTGIFYLTIPSLLVFGNTEFAVRLPGALLGALSVVVLYLLVIHLGGVKAHPRGVFAVPLIAALLLAISPWHISTSRATSEVVVALFLSLTGLYFFIRFLNEKKRKFIIFGLSFLLLSYFFYHSVRVLVPLFIGVVIVYYWKSLERNSKRIALGGVIILSLLTFLLSLAPEARGRFSQVSIFNDLDVQHELSKMPFEEGPGKVFVARLFHNKPSVYARRFINEYGKYFSADFLIGGSGKPARYSTVGMGLLTYMELALLVLGLIALAQRKFPALPLILLIAAPIPAALTTEDAPNLHRSLFMIPFIVIIGGYGWMWLSGIKGWGQVISQGTLVLLVLNFIFYPHMYYVHDSVHAPLYRNVGAKELALKLSRLQKDYDKIILTDIPDDPYPWIAFFGGRDPTVFNKDAVKREHGNWSTENLYFTGLRCPSRDAFKEPDVKRLLVVDADGCASESNLKGREDIKMDQITRTDGTEVYTLWSMVR